MPVLFATSIIFMIISIYGIVDNSVYNSTFHILSKNEALVAYILSFLYSFFIFIKSLFVKGGMQTDFSKRESIFFLISLFMYLSLIPLVVSLLNKIMVVLKGIL